jgi:hypothetical protein
MLLLVRVSVSCCSNFGIEAFELKDRGARAGLCSLLEAFSLLQVGESRG